MELFFASRAFADNEEFHNIVSLIIDEDTYGSLQGKIIRYARDVQNVLENTRVVITPAPSDASPLDIASLNESLYFEWYKGLEENANFDSRLIGTVLVWKIPLPRVYKNQKSQKTILPYIDFIDKSFIYNHESQKYEESSLSRADISPEIWHGVISPNTGNDRDDIQALKDYFDKNHDFYAWKWVFNQNKWVLDGEKTKAPINYEPQVFYYDQFRENAGLQYQNYVGYKNFVENKEDIVYKRYSKELAEKVKNQILWVQNQDIKDLILKVDPNFDISKLSSGPDIEKSSDILSRYVTDNSTKRFLQIFNESTLGDMRKHVFNAGRYNNGWGKVNVDMPPFLVSVLDEVSNEVIKNVNTVLENEITNIVANGISRKIVIPTSYQKGSGAYPDCKNTYDAFYFGRMAQNITLAEQCSIYKGSTSNSGTLVEANRGRNISLTENDAQLCGVDIRVDGNGNITEWLSGYWGGNSPVNLAGNNNLQLWKHNLKWGIRQVFDIVGAKKITDTSKIPSPIDCFSESVLLHTFYEWYYSVKDSDGWRDYYCWGDNGNWRLVFWWINGWFQAPVWGKNASGNWSCTTVNPTLWKREKLEDIYGENPWLSAIHSSWWSNSRTCKVKSYMLWGKEVASTVIRNSCSSDGSGWKDCPPCPSPETFSYKTIPSHILHTSPTDEEFWAQIKSMYTPSLPIDKVRYIDFIWAKWGAAPSYGYQRIDFPQLFGVRTGNGKELTLSAIEQKTKSYLDNISAKVNQSIQDSNPNWLTGKQKNLYQDHLRTSQSYPQANFDLYQYLQDKPLEVFTLDGQSKKINYYDTLIFAIYWNNLNNISAKYKFIFEEYLSNEFTGNNYGFHLPKAKKSYEIGYFAAPGDSQNMYIKLDPDQKWDHPYADIIAANTALQTTLVAANVGDNSVVWKNTFECAPPDGVNIFQWIPAVVCWLKEMLPPKIKIGPGKCSDQAFVNRENSQRESCERDSNNNGVVDCIEDWLRWWSLSLSSDLERYPYNYPGILTTEIYTKSGSLATFDFQSRPNIVLSRVEIPRSADKVFSGNNVQVIYDKDIPSLATPEAYKAAQSYIWYTAVSQWIYAGKTQSYFYTRSKDANAYFQASLVHKDKDEKEIITLESSPKKIEIRSERMFVNTYKVQKDGSFSPASSGLVSNLSNICLAEWGATPLKNQVDQTQALSDAEEKLLLLVQNYSLNGNTLELNYPLNIELLHKWESVFQQSNISKQQLSSVIPLFAARKSGTYELKIRDALGAQTLKILEITPDKAKNIQATLSTNIAQIGGNISTHIFTIQDAFDNLASGQIYTVDIDINGRWLVFAENNSSSISYNIAEGYKAFQLKTTDIAANNTLRFTLKDLSGNVIHKSNASLQTLDDIRINMSVVGSQAKVGWEAVKYNIVFTDGNGNILDRLKSRVYFKLPKQYGQVSKAYFPVKNWRAQIEFTPKTLAVENAQVELEIEGSNTLFHKNIRILPEDPIKIDLHLSAAKIEANPQAKTIVEAVLKDRYNNDVFTDSSTQVLFEIANQSSNILSITTPRKQVSKGKVQFEVFGTQNPGTGFFKVHSIPPLSNNSFFLEGQAPFKSSDLKITGMKSSGDELTNLGNKFFRPYSDGKLLSRFATRSMLENSEAYSALPNNLKQWILDFWDSTNGIRISGISENAGSIETFFFWKDTNIKNNSYNTYYSILAGAAYGDISQENYLAGSMLFDRNNNALGVSTLLNNPHGFNDVIILSQRGGVLKGLQNDITQDIQLYPNITDSGQLYIDIENSSLDNYIWKLLYKIGSYEYINLTDINKAFTVKNSRKSRILQNSSGKKLFETRSDGTFKKYAGVSLEFDEWNKTPWMHINIVYQDDVIARLYIEWEFQNYVTRENVLVDRKLATSENTVVFLLESHNYSTRSEAENLFIYYKDPFSIPNRIEGFHESQNMWLEFSLEEKWISWEKSNTMLLSVAAGESIGEASKHFQSFSFINLWDPVFSLKYLDETFKNSSLKKSFDSTVGKLLIDDDTMVGYKVLDYNNDDKKDFLTIHRDGYLKLYRRENISWKYVYHNSYWFAADGGGTRNIQTGDFTWDGYDDIFFLSNSGTPELFNNHQKNLVRVDISSMFSLSGSIIQVEAFDMDNDAKDDLIVLDDRGEIHIFYGGGSPESPQFTKKYVWDGYAISLSDTTTNHGGALYFDGMVSLDDSFAAKILKNSQSYLNSLQKAYDNVVNISNSAQKFWNQTQVNRINSQLQNAQWALSDISYVDTGLIDSLVFVELPYTPRNYNSDDNIQTPKDIVQAFSPNLGNTGSESVQSIQSFLNDYNGYVKYSDFSYNKNQSTYFVRSQYAQSQGINIEKKFTDTTPPLLQSWDRVYFDISLTNTTRSRINNIAYADNIPKFFKQLEDNFQVLSENGRNIKLAPSIGNYNIFIDGFYLDPGETTTIRFTLETLPLEYGHLQVWLFEAGELGDDTFGDIILKEDNKNCGAPVDIYRSTAARSYQAGEKTPVCNSADAEIGNTFPKLKDSDNNGIPDYLEELLTKDASGNIVPTDNLDALTRYRESIFNEMYQDSDNDGIPDEADSMDHTDSATDFMGALNKINEKIDEIASELDTVIEWLGCGFWWGSCISNPLNWAPLAPGNDPILFGKPVGDGLHVNEGTPIFSALTWVQTSCGLSPCCLPSVYPMSSKWYIPGPFCGPPSAGGRKGTWAPTNHVRIFATPTLTGAGGVAICFGWPAIAAGNSNPIGVHPVVPGGNCIVYAKPLLGCEGGEWDPSGEWIPTSGSWFSVIHANCDGETGKLITPMEIEARFIQDYFKYLESWVMPAGMDTRYESTLKRLSKQFGSNFTLPSGPLINIGNSNSTALMETSVNLDTSALVQGNLSDVVQVNNKRIGGFPSFMMDWVERQLDEVTSKLTNLPKIYVILPDFWGIFDFSWQDFGNDFSKLRDSEANKTTQKTSEFDSTISALEAQKSSLDCSGNDRIACQKIDLQITSQKGKKYIGSGKEKLSGISEVYDFIGNIPLVNVETETIQVNIPWIDNREIERFLVDWKYSVETMKEQLTSASNDWSLGASCTGTPEEIQACQKKREIGEKIRIDAAKFIQSWETNIQILEEYKWLPEQLENLFGAKQKWLEQILCNIEAISWLLWEWLKTNGERFKAWVELYLLIKAVLKSWQLFIDVFKGYEEECHQCKNERNDLQGFFFQLISAVIPTPPIIEFPKWPDIILDLHNIRAGMTVYMPDFNINLRPIVLPASPTLSLPATPDANISLPAMPTLPRFEIPEMPNLPSLPSIELPDLPPPPKIPKLFGAVEGVLNIMKLVSKVMCILKQSPFVPEWRAGDQIAFITERNGYLPAMDFIDIQPPTFSYSALSAIKVTTYVNFEFEFDFLIEALRSAVAPLDNMTNNIVNMADQQRSNIEKNSNFEIESPIDTIDVDINNDGSIDSNVYVPKDTSTLALQWVALLFAQSFQKLYNYVDSHSFDTLSNTDFKNYVGQELASRSMSRDPKMQELRDIWTTINTLQYSKENKLIQSLQDNRIEKFRTLRDILNSEIEYSEKQLHDFENIEVFDSVVPVLAQTPERVKEYNESLDPFNEKTLAAAIQLATPGSEKEDAFAQEIQDSGEKLQKRIKGGLWNYKNYTATPSSSSGTPSYSVGGSCSNDGTYKFVYDGIYIEEDGKNYKLFDYTDMLSGNEVPHVVDIDNDGDDDIMYRVNGRLYLKENNKIREKTNHIATPLIVRASQNVFFNRDNYIEALNGLKEAGVSDGAINVEFQKPTNKNISQFRMKYHTIVDRYLGEDDQNFIPKNVETHIIDAFSEENDAQNIVSETPDYSLAKNYASFNYIGAIPWIKLTQKNIINIRDNISDNTQVTMTRGTHLYAGSSRFSIDYSRGNSNDTQTVTVPAYHHIVFSGPATISALRGDAYIEWDILKDWKGTDMIDMIGLPVLAGAKIEYDGNTASLDSSSHVDIRYADGSEYGMDMRDISSYTLYDLGKSLWENYKIRLERPNDFYYARIQALHEWIEGTWTEQILLAPQKYADRSEPQIGLIQKIRIPVYQKERVDFTPYIYEDGGLGNISDIRIDFDLETDTDGDGNPKNDRDTEHINILQSPVNISFEFGPFDTLFSRKILVALTDNNGNIGQREIPFEVYAPDPQIQAVQENTIQWEISEELADEPIRIYRYRGGVITRLEESGGTSQVPTTGSGSYSFQAQENSPGLELSFSGQTLAQIDEYSGQMTLSSPLTQTRVIPSNNSENVSAYPEIQILLANRVVFRQFFKMPSKPIERIIQSNEIQDEGVYVQVGDQERFNSFSVPLGAPINPGSLSVYANTDNDKTPIMTVFADGRVNIDESRFRLEYQSYGTYSSLVLVEISSDEIISRIIYALEWSYIMR